ncbi:TIGR02680 family protein [Rhodoglobus aureus]|uniref:TIGR02680 family protein n=1 Tax=Rhodoglobus aureus TaxID=191497 RepID=A0ABN1VEB3_9MICO
MTDTVTSPSDADVTGASVTDAGVTNASAGELATDSAASALPLPTTLRWQPLRLGLVDLFYYENEVFPFVDGRLLLRGNNGAGKSKVLALTLPFLFDGDLSPQRIEPDGDRQKRMEWNLLLGDEHPNTERIGYSWLEFGRVDEAGVAHYTSIGAGLKAARGRGITKHWFFVTSERVGGDLALTDATRVALSQGRLSETLGEKGQVYTTKGEYRRAVDEKLFGLGERRYSELVELLLHLRAPQLSKRPSESALDEALSRSLTPVADDVLKSVADGLRSLDEERDELSQLTDAERSVRAFLGHYRAYARVLLRRQAEAPRHEQADHDKHGREIIAVTADRELSESVMVDAVARLSLLRTEQTERTAEREALRDSEHVQSERQIALADESADRADEHHAASESRATSSVLAERRAVEEADAASQRAEKRLDVAKAALATAEQSATAAGIQTAHVAVLTGPTATVQTVTDDPTDALAADQAAATTAVRRAREAITRIRSLRQALAEAERAFATATKVEADADSRQSEAVVRSDAAVADVDREVVEHIGRVERALAMLTELRVVDDDFEAFVQWVRMREDDNPAVIALQADAAEKRGGLGAQKAAADARLRELEELATTLSAEIAAIQSGVTLEPDALPTRAVAFPDAVPFWRAVTFVDTVTDVDRAGLEAALEASGLLTAVFRDGESPGDGTLHDPANGEVLLRAVAPVAGPSLLDVLQVELPSDTSVDEAAVDAVLASIALPNDDDDDTADVSVSVRGHFRLGPARGRWSTVAARYIGETARAAARERRLVAARAEHEIAEVAASSVREELHLLEQRLRTIDREVLALPSARDLDAAESAAAVARELAARAAEEYEVSRTAVATATLARDEAIVELETDATLLGLPVESTAIDALDGALDDYDRAAHGFWHAVERLFDARAASEATAARLAEAKAQSVERSDQLAEALEQTQSLRAYADALRAQLGAGVAEYRARVSAVEAVLKRVNGDIRSTDKQREAAAIDGARLGERLTGLRTQQQHAAEARRDAVEQLRRTTELGIAAVAVPNLEFPGMGDEWTATRGVHIARAIDAELSDVDASETRYERLTSEVHTQINELQRSLGRHDYEVAAITADAGVRVFVTIKGRETTLPELEQNLTLQIDQHERMLSAREREIIHNHLVTEVGAQLSELIGDADQQIAEINEELRRRPTTTGMMLRVLWRARADGPAGLADARRLLGTASEVWSDEDRVQLGAFLQARIAEVRDADETGNWYDHLGEALDYRRWHRFSVERKQGGTWKSATGPASGGERVLAASIPLFAAASSHYRTAANPHAPRIIMLDEAFAGVDDNSRANCLGLLAHFDLDVVMTSEREWGCYAEVPGLSIAQLSRFDDTPAVYVQLWRWDGTHRTLVGDDASASASGELW